MSSAASCTIPRMAKHPTSFRFSAECTQLLERLAEHLGITQTAVMEMAVRKLARAELPPEEKPKPKPKE